MGYKKSYNYLGRQVSSFRKATGMRQEDLAKKLSISVNSLRSIEQGKRKKIDYLFVRNLAKVLDVFPEDLFSKKKIGDKTIIPKMIGQIVNEAKVFNKVADFCAGFTEDKENGIFKNEMLTAEVVNKAFAIELYLKAILLKWNIPYGRTHKLFQLFGKLHEKEQKKIAEAMQLDTESFERALSIYEDAFSNWRYFYEHNESDPINLGFFKRLYESLQHLYESSLVVWGKVCGYTLTDDGATLLWEYEGKDKEKNAFYQAITIQLTKASWEKCTIIRHAKQRKKEPVHGPFPIKDKPVIWITSCDCKIEYQPVPSLSIGTGTGTVPPDGWVIKSQGTIVSIRFGDTIIKCQEQEPLKDINGEADRILFYRKI